MIEDNDWGEKGEARQAGGGTALCVHVSQFYSSYVHT